MAAKKKEEEVVEESEQDKVDEHRRHHFRRIFGKEWPEDDILSLVKSPASHHDATKLLLAGCPKPLIVKILV